MLRPTTIALVLALGLPALAGATGLDLEGRAVDPLAAADDRPVVLVFVRTDCPIANRYAPEISRLREHFGDRVRFWLVYPDPAEDAGAIDAHRETYALTPSALRDPEHALVRLAGASITPEAAVFSAQGELVYRGRIDDRWADFGQSRPAPTRRDLQQALEALLAGRSVDPARTRAVGCFISDLR